MGNKFLQLTDKERSIKLEANGIYQRPEYLANTLTKYNTLAHKQKNFKNWLIKPVWQLCPLWQM